MEILSYSGEGKKGHFFQARWKYVDSARLELNTNVSFMHRDKSDGRGAVSRNVYMCRRMDNRMRIAIMWGRNGVGIDHWFWRGGGHWRWRAFDFQRGLSISVVCPIPFVFHWECRRIGLIVPGNSPCFHIAFVKILTDVRSLRPATGMIVKRVFLEHL